MQGQLRGWAELSDTYNGGAVNEPNGIIHSKLSMGEDTFSIQRRFHLHRGAPSSNVHRWPLSSKFVRSLEMFPDISTMIYRLWSHLLFKAAGGITDAAIYFKA